MYVSFFIRLAQRAATIAGVWAVVEGSWRALETWYYENFSSNPNSVAHISMAVEYQTVATNVYRLGGLDLAISLHNRKCISVSVLIRVFLIHALAKNSTMPASAAKKESFDNIFKSSSDVPKAYSDPGHEDLVLGAVIRQLEAAGIVDFYKTD